MDVPFMNNEFMIIKSNLNSFVIPYLENHTVNEYESSSDDESLKLLKMDVPFMIGTMMVIHALMP